MAGRAGGVVAMRMMGGGESWEWSPKGNPHSKKDGEEEGRRQRRRQASSRQLSGGSTSSLPSVSSAREGGSSASPSAAARKLSPRKAASKSGSLSARGLAADREIEALPEASQADSPGEVGKPDPNAAGNVAAGADLHKDDESPDVEEPRRAHGSVDSTCSMTETSSSSTDHIPFMKQRKRLRRLLGSPQFDAAIGVVILTNCITIGVEQTYDIEGKDSSHIKLMEHIFLTIYLTELLTRFAAFGSGCLVDNWVKFDFFLVVLGILTAWILTPILGKVDQLGPFMVLRTARLMRLARTVRLLIKFRELWMLVRGLLNSASTMVYTLMMMFIIIYIFSCVSIELITNHTMAAPGPDYDPEFAEFVNSNFRSLPLTMMTLMQFATLDNICLLYMPLIQKSWWLAFFFIFLILVISIVLMNLITAVVVNSALEQAMSDKQAMKAQEEKRKKKLMKDLKRMFVNLDDDQSGQVSEEEMAMMSEEDKHLLYSVLGVSDPLEVFKQLDIDGSGLLEIDEFCDGIWQVAVSKAPIELKRIEKQVHQLKHVVQETRDFQNEQQEMLSTILASINAGRVLSLQNEPGNRQHCTKHESRCCSNESPRDEPKAEPKFQENAATSVEYFANVDTRPKQQLEEVLTSWKSGLDCQLTSMQEALHSELKDLSFQMSTALESRCSTVPSSPQADVERGRIVSLGEDLWEAPVPDNVTMPIWASDLRHELLQSIRASMEALLSASRPTERLQLPGPREPANRQGPLWGLCSRSSQSSLGSSGSSTTVGQTHQTSALGNQAPASLGPQPAWAEELKETLLSELTGLREYFQTSDSRQVTTHDQPSWVAEMMQELQTIAGHLESKSSREANRKSGHGKQVQ